MQIRSVGYGLISFALFCSKYENLKCCCKWDKNLSEFKLCAQFGLGWLGPDQFSFVVDYVPKTGNAVAAPTSNQDQRAESAGREVVFLHLTYKGKKEAVQKKNRKCLYIPQHLKCAAPSQIETIDHNPLKSLTRMLHSYILRLRVLSTRKSAVKKISLNSSKLTRCNFFSHSKPSTTIWGDFFQGGCNLTFLPDHPRTFLEYKLFTIN